jgi:hypothetical protein
MTNLPIYPGLRGVPDPVPVSGIGTAGAGQFTNLPIYQFTIYQSPTR